MGHIAPSSFPCSESSPAWTSSFLLPQGGRLLPGSSPKGKKWGISTEAHHSLLAQSKTLNPHRLSAQGNSVCCISADRKCILQEQNYSASIYKQAVKENLGVSCFPTLLLAERRLEKTETRRKKYFHGMIPAYTLLVGTDRAPQQAQPHGSTRQRSYWVTVRSWAGG